MLVKPKTWFVSKILGWLFFILGVLLFIDLKETNYVGSAIISFLFTFFGFEPTDPDMAGIILYFILFFLAIGFSGTGLFFFKYAKKLKALLVQEVLSRDHRQPVLYLRSFKDDRKAAHITALTLSGIATEEEQLAQIMNQIGPFIAVGEPGEKLPQLGAARMYMPEDDWQEAVKEQMSKARLVVFRAGNTPGFWWEVKEAARIVEPQNIIFLLPFDKKQYEKFRQKAEELLPCKLPEYRGRKVIGDSLRAILYFENNWNPQMRRLERSRFGYWLQLLSPIVAVIRILKKENLNRALKRTLNIVLEQHKDLSWFWNK